MNLDRAIQFLEFIEERHQIWWARMAVNPQPWTDNPILSTRKFTNVFRLLDPGSQFVMTDLMCENEFEFLARCLLYRVTNRPEAWRAFDGDLSLTDRPVEFRDHLHAYKASGGQVFSGAYMIWGGTEKGVDKIDHVFKVLDGSISGLAEFLLADTQKTRFEALARCRGIGDFNAMQVLTDFGYSTEFKEDLFVVPGPGARKGAAALEMDPRDAIEWGHRTVQLTQPYHPVLPTPDGRGRFPSKMDIQNCLCEFSKYVRYLDKPSPQKPYAPAHPGVQSTPVLPKHW